MAISPYKSTVTLPDADPRLLHSLPSIIDFLCQRFPRISRMVWEERIRQGKVLDEDGHPINFSTPYLPGARLSYFREVAKEPIIPFQETILHQDSHLIVACKPHFLPVIPSGSYVTQCLLHRLKERTDNPDLVPINRIDRETAGLVLFSVNPETRGAYQTLFMDGMVEKTYLAVTRNHSGSLGGRWRMENRIRAGRPWFRNCIASGMVNAVTRMKTLAIEGDRVLFQVTPQTGKKHQIRLHLSHLGFPILNDRFYPELKPEGPDDFSNPLQLLSKKISFTDPLTHKRQIFGSPRKLLLEKLEKL